MTTIRSFTCDDLFKFNNVNLDPLTETYGLGFYMQYLAHWPEYFQVAESPNGEIMGYIMGKAEVMGKGDTSGESWHGHVTALTVSPEYRRLGLAAKLMNNLEEISENGNKTVYWIGIATEGEREGILVEGGHLAGDHLHRKRCYFVDLFVRVSNKVAVDMYNRLGYSVYRRVIEYYSGDVDEDAFDMRKALSHDVEKKSIIPLPHPVRPEELD